MASVQVELPKGVWTQATIDSNDGSILHLSGDTTVVYLESETQPIAFDRLTPRMVDTSRGASFPYYTVKSGEFIWAYAINKDAAISVTPGGQYASR